MAEKQPMIKIRQLKIAFGEKVVLNDLDLDVNSGSSRLERLSSKPKNIGRERIFKFPEHYRKYIA